MRSTSTLARPLLAAPEPEDPPRLGLVLLAAAFRAALIALSGLVLVVGVALLLWAVTPDSGSEPVSMVRGGFGAFAAAHLLPVTVGSATLTLPPLLLTLLFSGFLAAGVARGRVTADGLVAELASAIVGAAAYTAVALAAVYLGAPAGAVNLRDGWRAGLLALVAAGVGTALRGTAWRARWIGRAPYWLQVGVRTGTAGAMVLIAGGAVALVVALVRSFATAAAVGEVAAPTAGDAFGMAVLGLVYLPTAVLAATGYVVGAGFQIGAGTYSPLGSHGVDLPAVPLLAAVPPTGPMHPLGLLVFLAPALAAIVVGAAVVRRLDTRAARLLATGTAGLVAAGVLTAILAVSGGGITGSTWAHLGVPLGWYALAVGLEIGLPAMAWAGIAGWTGVPWRAPAPDQPAATVDGADDPADEADEAEVVVAGPASAAAADRNARPVPRTLVWDITEGLPEAEIDDEADDVDPADIDPADIDTADVEDAESDGPEPDDTGPDDTGPDDTGPDDTGPDDTGPDDTEDTDSGEALLAGAQVDGAQPDGAQSDGAQPNGAQPNGAEDGSDVAAAELDGAIDAGEGGTGDPIADPAPSRGVARAFRGHRLLRRRQH